MDENSLPTSPRKKLKAFHDSQLMMDDTMVLDKPSTMVQDQLSTMAFGDDDRHDKEAQCGITQYVSPFLPGFQGILKKRYTDFLVNEILPNGQVIHLDDLKKPSDQKQLSQAASNPSHQQSPSSVQTPSVLEQDGPAKDNAPPRFESTGLNKVKEGTRKKETVYMRHGADSLSLMDKPDNLESKDPKITATAEQKAVTTQDEAPEAIEISGGIEGAPIEAEASGYGAPVEAIAPKDEQADDHAGLPHPSESGDGNAIVDWQAYAVSNTKGPNFELSDRDKTLLNSYFSAGIVEQIVVLFRRILASPLRKARDFGSVTTNPIDREVRTQIHQVIRRIFLSKLETVTDDSGAMVVTAASQSSNWNSRSNGGRNTGRNDRNGKPEQPKGKLGWAQLGGDYLHFTIYKENKDTMEAISWLARGLRLRPQLFQFAGTKDRRGITVQRASVYRVQAKKLSEAGRTLRHSKIGNFEYHPQGLQLGDLLGNEFHITLRDCHFRIDKDLEIDMKVKQARSILSTVIENFSSHGFINYFGLQRFGSFSTGTHTVGRSMLQGDFKAACEAILSFSPAALAAAQMDGDGHDFSIDRDDKARASALHAFATTGNSKQALDQLPRKLTAEASLIRHLSRSGHQNDYLGALQTISRNLRLMYVHAYQSLVWNIAATARWKAHGDKVLPGDLVLVNEYPDPATKPVATDKIPMEVDQDGEPIVAAEASDRAYTTDEIFTRARAVTESELASPERKITIFDIVLPLPGYDILYPANDSANTYKEFMGTKEGGGLDPYDMRRKWKDVSLSGSYRKLLAKPLGRVEWSVRAYGAKGDDEQFVETDLEKLEKARYESGMWGRTYDGNGASKKDDGKAEDPSTDAPSAETQILPDSKHNYSPRRPSGRFLPADEVAQIDAGKSMEDVLATPAYPEQAAEPKTDDVAASITAPPFDMKQEDETRNDKIAVILKMQLGSSTYATMALRELMKEGGVRTWKGEFSGGR